MKSYTNRQNNNINTNRTQINSPYNQRINKLLEISPSQSNYERSFQDNNSNKFMTEQKPNEISYLLNKRNYNYNQLENNKTSSNYSYNNIKKINPNIHINKDYTNRTEANNHYLDINNASSLRLNNNLYNNNFNNNSILSNNNSLLNDMNINNFNFNTNKKQIINDENIDYIDFLKKQYEKEPNNSNIINNNSELETNNSELIKRCQDLIEDNRLLNTALNERTAKLNKIMQENINLKCKIEENKSIIQKNEQKINFYENQFALFKNNNENYQKIINELKNQNEKLNINLNKIQISNNEIQKNSEENFKKKLEEEILNIKNNLKELYNAKNNNNIINNENENIIKKLSEEIKLYKDKNNELNNKIEIINLENQKLLNQNKLYHSQIETYVNQINDLSVIIKNKDNLINTLKEKEIENLKKEKTSLTKSKSCSIMRIENNELFNENIMKLMNDNKENKKKIELLNNRLKSIDEIERKYNAIINKKPLYLENKISFSVKDNENKNNNQKNKKKKKIK